MQLEYPSDTSQVDVGDRRESYLQWRRRLADQQEDLRNYGERDEQPTVSSEWSPEALYVTSSGSTASAEVAPLALVPTLIPGDEPIVDLPDPDSDAAWDRSEVEALLRQFRSTVGSPRAAGRVARVGSTPDLVPTHDEAVIRYFDGSRVVRTSTPQRSHAAAGVGEELRELNRLRVEGALDDDEFNRRKRALFARSRADQGGPG